MSHPIYRFVGFEVVAPYVLRVRFDDTSQTIDVEPVLAGGLYAPRRELEPFNRVGIDPEVHTLVWPNEADFDPVPLHDWPQYASELRERARQWHAIEVARATNSKLQEPRLVA
jgi:hypothetical protein